MEKDKSNNYEKQVYISRELFMKYDQQVMLKRLPLEYDETYIYLTMLDARLRISRASGIVEIRNEEDYAVCIDFSIVMTVYDILCYSETIPALSGMWCPLSSFQVTSSSPDSDVFTIKYARAFSGKIQELKEACRKIGGTEPAVSAHADVCWQFDIFSFFPIQFRYWDGDDEFEPRIQLLWDKNSLKFMHFETMYYALGVLMQRLETLIS